MKSEKAILKEADIVYWLIVSGLYVFFISDAVNKLLLYFEFDFNRVSVFIRSIYELLFFAVIIVFANRQRVNFIFTFLIALLAFLTGQIVFSWHLAYKYDFLANFLIYNKYFFLFVIYYSAYRIDEYPNRFREIISHFENLIYFNSIAIIIGFIFHLEFLRTYVTQPYRYGYSGFIPAQNEATLFFFISVSFFYYRHFIQGIKSYRFFVVLISTFLLGTKGIYLFLGALLLFHFLNTSSTKAKVISATFSLGGYFLVNWFLSTASSKILLAYFIDKMDEHGWLYVLVSGRNTYVEKIGNEIFDNWSIVNYFFGGQDQTRFLVEMDFFDLFFFLGGLGGLLYIVMCFITLFKLNIMKTFNLFFVLTFFGLAFFGGHFFASAMNSLYLFLICIYLKNPNLYEKDFVA